MIRAASSAAPRRSRNQRGQGVRLATDIVDAAIELLTETPADRSFSLRAVAARIGIAAPSIYRHFADKDRLIAAVMTRLFAELAAARDDAEKAVLAAGGTPWERLLARSIAYARFGIERGGHYRLLYEDAATARLADPAAAACGAAMTRRTVELLRDIVPAAGGHREAEAERIAMLLWATLHGIVSLRLHRPALPWPPIETAVRQAQEACVR